MLERLGTLTAGLLVASTWALPCTTEPYECAMASLARHDPRAAAATLREFLKRDPGNLKARNLLGIALLENGDTKEAAAAFSHALAENPAFYPARKNLAVAQFTLGQFDLAERNFEKVLAEHGDDPVSYLYLGEFAFRAGDCVRASQAFANAGQSLGSIPAFAVHYAECLIQSKRTADAILVLRSVPVAAADAQFAAGLLLAKAGSYKEAAPFFHQARQGFNDRYAAVYNEVYSYFQAGQYQEVVDIVDNLVREGSAKGELLNFQASAYRKLNNVRDAYAALRQAVRISPNDEANYIDLADLCLDHDNFDLGLEIVNIGLKNIPDSERLHVHRGAMLAMTGKLNDAESDFEFAAEMSPDASLPQVALSMIWMYSGDLPKAIETLRRRDKNNTTDFTIPFLLGQALTRQGVESGSPEEKEAISVFEKAVRLDPNYAAARAELGKMLLRRGEEARAITELERALSLDPQDRTAAYQLAQVYRKKGQQQRAAELRARVSDLNARDRDQDLRRAMVKIVRDSGDHGRASAPSLHQGQAP